VPEPPRIEPLGSRHDRASFGCSEPALDAYLQRQASQDVRRRVAQVFVLLGDTPNTIAGYYTLSATSFDRGELPETQARRLPRYPVPAAIIGRLAVDQRYQGRRRGETLLIDAVHRVLRVSDAVAMHAIIVDAKDDAVVRFYARYGFVPFNTNPRRLALPLETFVKGGL
jgi:GNAT superfamily N-acetyltransferase